MSIGHNDHGKEIRDLFKGLQRQDTSRMPLFERVVRARTLAGEAESRFSFSSLRLITGGAAAAALVLALANLSMREPRGANDVGQWSALSNWRDSTDTFLSASISHGWGSSMTTTTDAWLENWNTSELNETTPKKAL